jgi:formate hydrogenlyase transcriptional activator
VVNCAALPAALVESELFGHERGAFTGAVAANMGRFQAADRGTLFLDEVGDLPMELQPKLLRAIQEQAFERVGSSRTTRVDVRIVAATNQPLGQLVEARRFRMDLYYRLNVFPIPLPPLRERREDVPLLVRHFVRTYAARHRKSVAHVPDDAMAALVAYQWPGNIRELQNLIERSVVLSKGAELQVPVAALVNPRGAIPGARTLADADRAHIISVLRETNWTVGGPHGAAARLGLFRTTLLTKMRKLGIARDTAGEPGQWADSANPHFRGQSRREAPPQAVGSTPAGSF